MKTQTESPVTAQHTRRYSDPFTIVPDCSEVDDGFVVLDGLGNFFARTYSSHDARLIAAAPEFLAALKEIMRVEKGAGDELSSWGHDIAHTVLLKHGFVKPKRSKEAISLSISDALREVAEAMGDDAERAALANAKGQP